MSSLPSHLCSRKSEGDAKAGAEPLTELDAFLELFAKLPRRAESRGALERYATGLPTDVGRKTASEIGRAWLGPMPSSPCWDWCGSAS